MFMLCCFAKVIFYFALTVYHCADCFFDWRGYHELYNEGTFSAIPKHNSLADGFFLASCLSGTILSIAMLIAYSYYIKYHVMCMCTSDTCDKECDRRFITLELAISVFELLFKDDIQSVLVFLIYQSGPEKECVSSLTKVFTICSIIAHLKLLICFFSKLCGIGAGEKCDGGVKCLFCFLGSIGSFIFLVFTSLYFAGIHNIPTCGTLV